MSSRHVFTRFVTILGLVAFLFSSASLSALAQTPAETPTPVAGDTTTAASATETAIPLATATPVAPDTTQVPTPVDLTQIPTAEAPSSHSARSQVAAAAWANPRAFWQFEQNLLDSSPNHNDGSGTARHGAGISGYGLLRDGLELPIPVTMTNDSLYLGGSALTLEAWVNGSNYGGGFHHIIDNVDSYALSICDGRLAMLGPNFWWQPQTSTGPDGAALVNPVLSVDAWHYVVGTYDGSQQMLYVDGNLVAFRAISAGVPYGHRNVGIGGWGGIGPYYLFKGVIDNLRVSDNALSASAIKAEYDNILHPQPISVQITDAQGNAVSALGLNGDGWPISNTAHLDAAANPLTVTVMANIADVSQQMRLTLDSSDNAARFFVIQTPPGYTCNSSPSQNSYAAFASTCLISSVGTVTLSWQVWVQPSQATSLNVKADILLGDGTASATGQTQLSIPQAAIHPIMFLPGLGVTQPPTNDQSNPLLVTGILGSAGHYPNLYEALEKMGYEMEKTLFIFPYDWLGSNIVAASHLRARLEQASKIAATVPWVAGTSDWNNINFDLIGHSTGNLVARTYIQLDQGIDPRTGESVALWNGHVRRWVSIAGPLQGIYKVYTVAESAGADIKFPADLPLWTAMAWWAPPLAEAAGYGHVSCRPRMGCNWVWNDASRYQFMHDPIHGINIIPEFLPTYQNEMAYLFNASGDFPFGRAANSLLESGTNPANKVFDYYRDNPYVLPSTVPATYITPYYGLNTPDALQRLNDRLQPGGTSTNVCVIYGGGNANDTIQALEVTNPSHRVPYWRNGQPVLGSEIKGPGDTFVAAVSGSGGSLWLSGESPQNDFESGGDVDLDPSISSATPKNESDHSFIVGYDVTIKRISKCLVSSEIPQGMLAGFSADNNAQAKIDTINQIGKLLRIVAHSPVELTLLDPAGRRLGYNSDGTGDYAKIPNAIYFRDSLTTDKYLLVYAPAVGVYTLTVTGTGSGAYTIMGDFASGADEANLFLTSGMATNGGVFTQSVVVPSSVAEVPAPPVVDAGPDMSAVAGQPVTLAGQVSDINPNDQFTTAWDFGDGNAATGVLTPTHTYIFSDTFTAALTVTDTNGFVVSNTVRVSVAPPHDLSGLLSLLAQMYQQGQITTQGVYQSSYQKLVNAQKDLDKGQPDKAVKKLQDFWQQVDKESGMHILPRAATTLKASAESIWTRLQ